jgi:hypothetical protein
MLPVHHHKNEAIFFVALGDVVLDIHQKGPCPVEPVETNQPVK